MKATRSLPILKSLLIILLVIEVINLFSGRWLVSFGIYPREVHGLIGIISAPLIHGSIQHFFANIIPLMLFSWLLLYYGRDRYIKLSLFLVLSTGLSVWLFARASYHVGASGIIYGYFAYLLFAGWLSKRLLPTLVSCLVAVLYGGMIFGVLPLNNYISWESHLFGFIMGLIAVKLFPLDQYRAT